MKTRMQPPALARRHALTFSEVLAIIAVLTVMAYLLGPTAMRPVRAKINRMNCASQLKSMGVALREFASVNDHNLPPAALTNQDLWLDSWEVAMIQAWQSASNQLVSPRMLVCPADVRFPAVNLALLTRSNLSYFLSLDATLKQPQLLLAGDRNLTTNGVAAGPGVVCVNPQSVLGASAELHGGTANLLFSDGSVRSLRLQASTPPDFASATNRLAVP